jgi:glycosyl transferase family 4
MRVLLVGNYPSESPSSGGGVETAFVNLVQGLKELDQELDLHVTSLVRRTGQAKHAEGEGFVIHFLEPQERLGNLTLHAKQRKDLRRLVLHVQPTVVHAQNAVSHGYACLKAAPEFPVVVSVHGIIREELKFADTRVRVQSVLTTARLQRYCIRHARYLTQPTSYSAPPSVDRSWMLAIPFPLTSSLARVGRRPDECCSPADFFAANAYSNWSRLLHVSVGVFLGSSFTSVAGRAMRNTPRRWPNELGI